MPDIEQKSQDFGINSSRPAPYYRLTAVTAKELREMNLHASEWRLWSYFATLEPFGDGYIELPDMAVVLEECKLSRASFYRALAKLDDLFDISISQVYIRNLRGAKSNLKTRPIKRRMDESHGLTDESKNLTDEKFCLTDETISFTEKNQKPDRESNEADRPVCTNNKHDHLKKNKTPKIPPSHPVLEPLDSKGLGTPIETPELLERDIARLVAIVQESGITINRTISRTITAIRFNEGSAAATRAVENACSAVREQISSGAVRNPGGLLMAALQRRFTENEAKRRARERSPVSSSAPLPPALDLIGVSIAIDQALRMGDRTFALGRLGCLVAEGYESEVRELCQLRQDWQIKLTNDGIRDRER